MKVLIVAGLAGPGAAAGGVWTVARTQSEVLRSRGHEVELMGGWLGADTPLADAGQIVPLRQLIPGAGLKFLFNPEFPRRVRAAAQDADVVHIHLARDYATTASLRGLDAPVVAQPHGMLGPGEKLSTRAFDMLYRRRMLDRVDLWLSLTPQETASLESFGVSRDRLRTIDNAVISQVTDVPIPPSRPRFAFISRFHRRKQPDVFVRAGLRALAEVEADFFLAGPDEGALSVAVEAIRGSGFEQRFRFAGPLAPDAAQRAMSGSTALVLPSIGEIAPMVALEAAANGTPLILTVDCGIAPAFEASRAALVVRPNEVEVSQAMVRLARDPDLAQQIARNALALVKARWSADALGGALESVYLSLLGDQ